jgi:hypothetical protein
MYSCERIDSIAKQLAKDPGQNLASTRAILEQMSCMSTGNVSAIETRAAYWEKFFKQQEEASQSNEV